ncbi:hypothetical protein QZH41_003356 [Actinostola sp. cb2023]|nr:hypothetical protein QZH41_003356 [Actinostola sp. cb2023]
MGFMLVTLFNHGQWMFNNITCQINAFLVMELLLAAMFTICAISVNRYVKIVKPRWYSRLFNEATICKIVITIWMLPLLVAIPPLLGWSKYDFDPGKCICFFRTDHIGSYGLAVGVVTMGITVPIILYCYFWVFKVVGVHSGRMEKLRNRRTSEVSSNIEEIRITRTLLVVMATFMLCFLPGTVVVVVQVSTVAHTVPFWAELVGIMCAFANQAIDPIIYGFFNTQYRRAMVRLWSRKALRKSTQVNSTDGNIQQSITIHGRYSVGGALLVLFIATENELLRHNAIANNANMGLKRSRAPTNEHRDTRTNDQLDEAVPSSTDQ